MERPAYLLEFEKPLRELEKQLEALHQQSLENNIDMSAELATIEAKIDATKRDIYENLTPWQRVQVARHPKRPYALDYVGRPLRPTFRSCTATASSATTAPWSAAPLSLKALP
jgi:acetyl-CoA carboxylase carboxyl transferase subunit alpha